MTLLRRRIQGWAVLVVAILLFVVMPRLEQPTRRVLLISIDGLRADAVTPQWAPTLTELMARGVSTLEAHVLDPPRTVPNHVAMLTGLTPDSHGFRSNQYPNDRFVPDTVLEQVHDAGYTVAVYFSKQNLNPLANPALCDRIVIMDTATSDAIVDRVIEDFAHPASRWIFTVVHLIEPDRAGHDHGWMTARYLDAVLAADTQVRRLMQMLEATGLARNTLVIITSDHGGSGRHHRRPKPETVLVPWIAVGPGVPAGALVTRPVWIHDTAPTILAALQLPITSSIEGAAVEVVAGPAMVMSSPSSR